ncbi:MAG: methionine synthase [Nocardioides marinisabuli]|uniref:methionine synthase n=1 Tax=Nocardioides marinisabuli TaxID=419476 RepID=UPI00321A4043
MSVLATAIGSMPGEDSGGPAYREAVKVVLDSLPDLACVPELPGRGPAATMTGRTLAVVEGLDVDLQPAGWRLTGSSGSPGLDHRRTRSLLAQDLDAVEELGQGYTGTVKLQLAGPWTLAATVERPRGDVVLGDHGARRDLAEALAEGLGAHVRDVRRRMPSAAALVVQLDEPALASVLAGAVPTASGFGRHRTVHPPEASALLETVIGAVVAEGAEPWVHSCAAGTPLALLRGAGARGLLVDADRLGAADHDVLAEALEAGDAVVLGVVPSTDPDGPNGSVTDTVLTQRVVRWLDMLGLDPASGRLGVSPACGLAGASYDWSRRALGLSRAVADNLTNLG